MKFTIEDLKNLSALLQTGKFTVNAQESVILVNLTNKVVKMIEEEGKVIHETTTSEIKE